MVRSKGRSHLIVPPLYPLPVANTTWQTTPTLTPKKKRRKKRHPQFENCRRLCVHVAVAACNCQGSEKTIIKFNKKKKINKIRKGYQVQKVTGTVYRKKKNNGKQMK